MGSVNKDIRDESSWDLSPGSRKDCHLTTHRGTAVRSDFGGRAWSLTGPLWVGSGRTPPEAGLEVVALQPRRQARVLTFMLPRRNLPSKLYKRRYVRCLAPEDGQGSGSAGHYRKPRKLPGIWPKAYKGLNRLGQVLQNPHSWVQVPPSPPCPDRLIRGFPSLRSGLRKSHRRLLNPEPLIRGFPSLRSGLRKSHRRLLNPEPLIRGFPSLRSGLRRGAFRGAAEGQAPLSPHELSHDFAGFPRCARDCSAQHPTLASSE